MMTTRYWFVSTTGSAPTEQRVTQANMACQSAQAGLSLTGLGGWASRFIQPGNSDYAASAFVGSYWSVYDEAALGFAKNRLVNRGRSAAPR